MKSEQWWALYADTGHVVGNTRSRARMRDWLDRDPRHCAKETWSVAGAFDGQTYAMGPFVTSRGPRCESCHQAAATVCPDCRRRAASFD